MKSLPMMVWDAPNVHFGEFERGVSLHADMKAYEAYRDGTNFVPGMPDGIEVEVPDSVFAYVAEQEGGTVYHADLRNGFVLAQKIEEKIFSAG